MISLHEIERNESRCRSRHTMLFHPHHAVDTRRGGAPQGDMDMRYGLCKNIELIAEVAGWPFESEMGEDVWPRKGIRAGHRREVAGGGRARHDSGEGALLHRTAPSASDVRPDGAIVEASWRAAGVACGRCEVHAWQQGSSTN